MAKEIIYINAEAFMELKISCVTNGSTIETRNFILKPEKKFIYIDNLEHVKIVRFGKVVYEDEE